MSATPHRPGRPAGVPWRCAALLLAGAGVAAEPQKTESVGSPRKYPTSEAQRQKWFHKLHGQWPPLRTYPGGQLREETETPGWKSYMEDFEAEARKAERDSKGVDWRWERWLELAQMRMSRNYSATGWHHTRLDEDVHGEVQAAWREALTEGGLSGESSIGFYIQGKRDFWHVGNLGDALQSRLSAAVRRKIAAWTQFPDDSHLQMTSMYGLRSYLNGSVLKPHVDSITTHVLSAVYCVDVQQAEGAEPWYIGAEVDFSGQPAWVDLRGGELFLYESAKLPHGRPTTFIGERYTAIFMHFRPPDWNLENYDRVYALPPDFSEPHPKRQPTSAEL